MSFESIIFFLAINCAIVYKTTAIDCLSNNNEDNYKCHLGSATPYRFVANRNDSRLRYAGCEERKIWLLVRHGTRFPGKKMTDLMIRVLPELREKIIKHYRNHSSKVAENVIGEFVEWKPNDMVISDEKKLTEEGERELIDIAETFQSRFPTLLPEMYSNETYKVVFPHFFHQIKRNEDLNLFYSIADGPSISQLRYICDNYPLSFVEFRPILVFEFKYTKTQRTEESAKHFALGLFGQRAFQEVWYHPPDKKDIVLRSYKHCDRWQAEVKKNPTASEQLNFFINSQIVNETLDEISKRLGFTIGFDIANLFYHACGYETSWKRDVESPWCKLLSLDNFKVLEYVEDLELFWIDGYGFPLTYKQACPTLRDVFQFFESGSDPKATLYFSHSGMITKLLSFLGIAKDATPLTYDTFELHGDYRAWRASRIDAFATNVGFVLYDCEKEGPAVLFLHQERVTRIPGCPDHIPCPISVVKKLFSHGINNCNFTEMCRI